MSLGKVMVEIKIVVDGKRVPLAVDDGDHIAITDVLAVKEYGSKVSSVMAMTRKVSPDK